MTALLLTSGTVLVLTCVSFITYEFITLRKGMMEGYRTRAQIIAANSSASLAFQNEPDAAEVLGALKTDPKVTAGCLYDDKGKLFAKYPADRAADLYPRGPGESGYRNGHLEIFCPVVQGDRMLGTVYIQSDLSALTDRYRAYAWLVAAIIVVSLMAAYLLARLLQRQISIPILNLAETAGVISRRQDFSVRAQKYGDDELGLLTDAFNRMLEEILAREKALKASEANYREIFEKANDAIFVHELETGRVLDLNQRAVEMTGYTREELTAGHPVDISSGNPGYSREDAAQWMKKAVLEGPQVFEWQGKHKDGSVHWIEVSLGRASIGGKERLLAFFREIGERKKLQETLQSKNFITSVLENLPNMLFVKDAKDLRFVMFNKAGEDLLGLSRAELIGKNDYDFFKAEEADFFTSKDRKVLQEKKLLDIPEEAIQTNGKGRKLLHTKKIPILDGEGKAQYLLGISEDITEKKEQENLKIYTKALEVSNREMQDFVFVASHDLQEPLRKIQAFGEFLREEFRDALGEAGLDYVDRMRGAAQRMQTLINDLLSLTRVTTKAQPFRSIDLKDVLRDVLSDLETRIQEKKAKVVVGELPSIEADPTQMRQLFQNLIGNSLKFQRPGVEPEIRIKAEKAGKNCLITLTDNGIGFDNKYGEQIFRVFERLHGRDEYEGTGIGLAICQKVAERHGGMVRAQGEPGKGSMFTVILPFQQKGGLSDER